MADLMTLVGKTYVVKTFGCQMNLHDSERVSGLLDLCGCICVDETDQADIVVFMTCCVRENADQRLYGQASAMVSAPKPPCGRRAAWERSPWPRPGRKDAGRRSRGRSTS